MAAQVSCYSYNLRIKLDILQAAGMISIVEMGANNIKVVKGKWLGEGDQVRDELDDVTRLQLTPQRQVRKAVWTVTENGEKKSKGVEHGKLAAPDGSRSATNFLWNN